MLLKALNQLKYLTILAVAICALAPATTLALGNPQQALCQGAETGITSNPDSGSCASGQGKALGTAENDVNGTIATIVNLISAAVGVIAVIMIMVAGFRYVTSGGSESAVSGAKKTILYAVIGLVVVALAQLIVHFVLAKVTG